MLKPREIDAQLNRAHQLFGSGNFTAAEALYREVLDADPASKDALHSLFAICMKSGRSDEALGFLERLAEVFPREPGYAVPLANALADKGRVDDAVSRYERLFEQGGDNADTRFNLAELLRHAGRYEEALPHYERSIAQGASQPEIALTNMSVTLTDLNRHEEAQASLEQALARNPRFVPALYNLGLLHEEYGRIDESRELFLKVLGQAPAHAEALARLAHGRELQDPEDPLLDQLRDALARPKQTQEAQESLLYASGKVHDDLGRYDQAFDFYRQANRLSRERVGPYDADRQEVLTHSLVARKPMPEIPHDPHAQPVFVCGMFRSGSTLLEQMLAAHPDLTSGGEIDYFSKTIDLDNISKLTSESMSWLGKGYLAELERLFPGRSRVIDKRPDNILYLGIIRDLFPGARFLVTRRRPLDNCLSVYFQQLTGHFKYANELLDIAHYYLQVEQLIDHWRRLYPEAILEVSYDRLVSDPENVTREAMAFIGLEWTPECLNFYERDDRVRTASVWQVRQPLHTRSSGRWQHYAHHLKELGSRLKAAGVEL